MSIRASKKINQNKLVKILNLLESPMDGEVLAAAKSAIRYLKTHGSSWQEVIHPADDFTTGNPNAKEFIELKDSEVLKRTEKARLILVKLTNGYSEKIWFPCSTLREKDGKIYASRWILLQKEKKLSEEGTLQHIQVVQN